MKRINLQHLTPLIGLVLFIFALWVLNRTLGENSYRQIFRYMSEFPRERILGAIGLTAASYGLLTLYDHLALRYLKRSIGPVRVSLASFISYCFSRNIGFALLTGGSIRYRFYSAWGLSAEEVARLISFAAITFSLGLLTMGGALLVLSPAPLPELPFPVRAFTSIGAMALCLTIAYFLFILLRTQPLKIRTWEVPLPTPPQALAQLVVGSLDWVLKASILFYLLSGIIPLSLPAFLEIYLLAQIVATVSHVPGGLGVFETVVVLLIPDFAAPDLLASLMVYRGVYFLLPFATAILLLGGLEALQHAKPFRNARQYLDGWLSSLAPPVFAAAVLISGALLLFSCATPTMAERLEWLGELVPLPLIELAHFLAALAGAGLLLLAYGIQRRLQQAYVATMLLLTASIVLTLLKGLTYEQAIMLALFMAALIPSRSLFFRQTSLLNEVFPFGWMTTILIICGSAVWLVTISYEPQVMTISRWWHFALVDDAARSLRAMTGALTVLLAYVFLRSCRSQPPQPALPDPHVLETAQRIISRRSAPAAALALLGDKKLMFSKPEVAFLMYATTERFWVALGDPVGDPERVSDLAWCFREMCEQARSVPLFYLIRNDFLHIYLDMGLALLKVGDEATVFLESPPLARHTEVTTGLDPENCRFEIDAEPSPELLARLKRSCAQWEGRKAPAEHGFSQGSFDPAYMERFPIGLLLCNEQPVAFALLLQTADKTEFTIDLLRFSPQFGTGAAESFLGEIMAWGQRSGYRRFNFGVVPNADDRLHELPPSWRNLGPSVFRNGQSFASTQEMRAFLTSYLPKMRPCYVAFPGETSPMDVLETIAILIVDTAPVPRQRGTALLVRYCDPE